jgi:hypothetical protein
MKTHFLPSTKTGSSLCHGEASVPNNTNTKTQMKTTIIKMMAVFAVVSSFALSANAQLSAPFAGGILLQQGGGSNQANGLIMKAAGGAFNGGNVTLNWTALPVVSGILHYDQSTSSITYGALSLVNDITGILAIANGGTGASTAVGALNNLLPAQASNGGKFLTTDGLGNVTWAGGNTGTVTSVGLALPAELTVSNSPVTTTGTLTAAWANQTGNTIFASPANGSSGAPSFRSMVAGDVPNLDVAKITTGILPINRGGTNTGTLGAAGTLAYSDGTGYNFTAAGTSGFLLKSNGASAPSWIDPSTFGIQSVSGTAPVVVNTVSGAATVSLTQGDLKTPNSTMSVTGLGKTVGADLNVDLNLAHSNTWTADQILPTTSTQGDNLMAGVNNSGAASKLAVAHGGTNATSLGAAGTVAYSDGTGYNFTAAGTSGFLLKSNGASAPSWIDPSTFGIQSVVGTAPVVVNTASGTATVSLTQGDLKTPNSTMTVSGTGKTVGTDLNVDLNLAHSNTWTADQILPTTSTQGDNLMAGVNNSGATTKLAVAHGGTGVTSLTPNSVLSSNAAGDAVVSTHLNDGQIMIGTSAGGPTAANLTAGTGITITNAAGSITIAQNANGTNKQIYNLNASNYSYTSNPAPAGFTLTGTSVITITVFEKGGYPITATVTNVNTVANTFDFILSGYPTALSTALVSFQN